MSESFSLDESTGAVRPCRVTAGGRKKPTLLNAVQIPNWLHLCGLNMTRPKSPSECTVQSVRLVYPAVRERSSQVDEYNGTVIGKGHASRVNAATDVHAL